jgi:hypothetical protein
MGQVVMVAYRPKPGMEEGLKELIKHHVPILRAEGLATDMPPLVVKAADGTYVEIFEWKSREAVEQAHHSPAILVMWSRFAEVCDYQPMANLPECQQLFSPFELVKL